ncbi:YbjN domain-containing protein [Sporichthya brevicatena]|uniref:YbjN domain-containing protein n=1 Tax=Sporichthya brevicatena TaxID=171442 RepID=A0ABP3RL75_9ACTN
MTGSSTDQAAVCGLLRRELDAMELDWTEARPGLFVVTLPGTKKLSTTCALAVGPHALTINAFVARRPDENHEEVYRWLLERNARMYGVAFMIDRLGDIYLSGRVALKALDADEVDRLLGSVLEYADGSFNPILERGFASSIRKEHAWRVSRGESTHNLDAFRHLLDAADPSES